MNEAKFSGRRIVTHINEQGRSVIGLDGPPAEAIEFALGGGLHEIWTDLAGPHEPQRPRRLGRWAISLGPPSGGVKVRWFTVAPAPVGVPQAESRSASRKRFMLSAAITADRM